MRKYGICLLLCVVTGTICLTGGWTAGRLAERRTGQGQAAPRETSPQETSPLQTAPSVHEAEENRQAANQQQVSHEPAEEYYLVAEDGVLLVFLKDQTTVYLSTHVPLMDFPDEERDRLREGIWFSSMIEVFNYLESYTS